MHVERVIAAAGLICFLSSVCEMSQMEYGHTGNFLLYVGVTVFSGGVRRCVETQEHSAARHCVEFHSSATEDADQCMQFGINRVASCFLFQPLDPDTDAPLHEEREIAVRQELNVHSEF